MGIEDYKFASFEQMALFLLLEQKDAQEVADATEQGLEDQYLKYWVMEVEGDMCTHG